jgi:ABC-2 type transport system permease protein
VRGRRVAAVALRQWFLIRGSMSRIVPLFAWVVVDVVLWGFITRFLNSFPSTLYDFVPAVLGAVLLWDFLTRVMQGVTMAFFEDVWARNFLNVFATPIRISEYVGGLVTSSIATSAVGLVVMVLVAALAFHLHFLTYGLLLGPFLGVLFLFGIALGITGISIVLRLGPAAEWFIWPLPAIVSPFACVFYPLATLPPWMRGVARALPPTYVFEGLRAIVLKRPVPVQSLLPAALLAALYVGLACLLFVRVHRYAVRTGLIGRYSAETVS